MDGLNREALARALGGLLTGWQRLGGGDLSVVYRAQMPSGRAVAVKATELAENETRMLEAIGRTGCPVPEVIHSAPGVLVMSFLDETGAASADGWHAAGKAVRLLHTETGADFGWPEDHAFADALIPNGAAPDWPEFWARRRLLAWPGALPIAITRRLEVLADRLPGLLPPNPCPALLHGDLWSGNLLFGADGFSGLIDPASYFGHAEVDLAMLDLFGGLHPAFLEGYGTPEAGAAARRPVYQLWPALVHLRLFGDGYRPMVERLLDQTGV